MAQRPMSDPVDYLPRGTMAYDLARLDLAIRLLRDVIRRGLGRAGKRAIAQLSGYANRPR